MQTSWNIWRICKHPERYVQYNGRPKDSDIYVQTDSSPSTPPLITFLHDLELNNIRRPKEKEKKRDG